MMTGEAYLNDILKNELNICMNKLAGGCLDELSKLYSYLSRPVYFIALSILKDKYLAEDVLQDTFISVYKNIHTYTQNNPKAWVLTIARNTALNKLKKQSYDQPVCEFPRLEADGAFSSIELFEAFKVLSQEEELIVILYVIEGVKQIEIAKILSISYDRTRKKYRAAIKKLKNFLKD
jgi:RNA polymerase sigma-70 factor (ECF subfamily)